MTELNKRSIAAKARAERQKTFDPMFFKRKGSIGGLKKVPKGFSALSKEDRVKFARKGGLKSGGNIQAYNEKRKKL